MSVIGIDLGNAVTVISAAQKGGVDVLLNENSSRQTPTMVGFGEKERFLGEPAAVQYMRNIKNTITNFKRLIGHKFHEKEVQEEMKQLPFKTVELPHQEIGVEVMYQNERRVFSIPQVTAMFFQKVKMTVESALQKPCKDVVISVPGYWTDHQRRALLNAAQIANLNCLRLINDHASVALQYGIYKSTQFSETDPFYVMFIDMGHSNLSVSVVEFLKGKLKVLSTVFDRNLGGRNFDDLLVDHFAAEWKTKYKIDIKSNQRALIRVQVACERMKKVLNTNAEAHINLDCLMEDKDVSGSLTKEKFETMCKDLVERVFKTVDKALADSNIPQDKLGSIEIVGGASRLHVIKSGLAEHFKREIMQTLNAEEANAKGCALQCAMLSPLFKVREFAVNDITQYPIKVSWKTVGAETGKPDDVLEIFTENNVIPSPKMMTFYRTEPLELVAEYSRPELLPPGTPLVVSKAVVPNIPHKGNESAKVRVKVKLDLHGVCSFESAEAVETIEEVEAAPAATPAQKTEGETTPMDQEPTTPPPAQGEKQENKESPKPEANNGDAKKEEAKKKKVRRTALQITETSANLAERELNHLVEEEVKMLSMDKLAIETQEQKNAVESYVYDMRSKLNESLGPYATDDVKEKFSKLLEDTETWLYNEGENESKSAYVQKLGELKAIGEPIIKRKYEADNRYETLMQLRNAIQSFILAAESTDPKYDHIEQSEKQKVVDEAKAAEKWVNEEMMKQDKLPKHADPVLTVADLNKKKADLERVCNAILNKPKPKPKVEEKKEEEKKEAEKKEEKKEGQQAPPQAETKPENAQPTAEKPVEMDLD